jgi:hypothetical protein
MRILLAFLAAALAIGLPGPRTAAQGVGCVRTDRPRAPRPDGSVYQNIRGNPSYACTLYRGRAPVRLVLVTDARFGRPVAVRVYGAHGGRPVQVLPLDDAADAPPRGSSFFQGVDLNRDGWMDLKVLTTWGATGNQAFDVFRYEPARSRFVKDTTLTRLGLVAPVPGRPCVAIHWHMGIGVYSDGEYCWRTGRWVLVRTEVGDYLPPTASRREPIHVHTIRELRGGRLRVVQVDTGKPRH